QRQEHHDRRRADGRDAEPEAIRIIVLYFDTTPPAAALPATQPASAFPMASAKTNATTAFGDLLALLSGSAEQVQPKGGRANVAPASRDLAGGLPFAFSAPAANASAPST